MTDEEKKSGVGLVQHEIDRYRMKLNPEYCTATRNQRRFRIIINMQYLGLRQLAGQIPNLQVERGLVK